MWIIEETLNYTVADWESQVASKPSQERLTLLVWRVVTKLIGINHTVWLSQYETCLEATVVKELVTDLAI